MVEIKIFLFGLASFFMIEDGRIVADKTTVTVDPKNKTIEIIQEGLFTLILSDSDTALVLEQWNRLSSWEETETPWAQDLDGFTSKSLTIKTKKKLIQPHLAFTYSNEKDLEALGIWYNTDKNQFSINHVPEQNVKTETGEIEGNYLVFNGDRKFSFTIEPFSQMPERQQKLKKYLRDLLRE